MLESAEVELLAVIPDMLTGGEVVPGDFVSEVAIVPEGSLVEFLEARIAVAVLFSGTTLHSSTTGSMIYPDLHVAAHLLFCQGVHFCSSVLNPH